MKKVIFIIVLGVLGATLFSCEPSELEMEVPFSSTVGEDGDPVEEDDDSGSSAGNTVGEDGDPVEEDDDSGSRIVNKEDVRK